MPVCQGDHAGGLVSSFSQEAPESYEHHEEWVWAQGERQALRRGCRRGKREKRKGTFPSLTWWGQVPKGQGEGVCGNQGGRMRRIWAHPLPRLAHSSPKSAKGISGPPQNCPPNSFPPSGHSSGSDSAPRPLL